MVLGGVRGMPCIRQIHVACGGLFLVTEFDTYITHIYIRQRNCAFGKFVR
jgi:hypothetical protein